MAKTKEVSPTFLLCNNYLDICSNYRVYYKNNLNDTFNSDYEFKNFILRLIWSCCSVSWLNNTKQNIYPWKHNHKSFINTFIQKHESFLNKWIFWKVDSTLVKKCNMKIIRCHLIAIFLSHMIKFLKKNWISFVLISQFL